MSERAPRRHVDGVLLLDKPQGITSNAALQRAKRLYAAQKAGHSGTLDPLASGLLPICFGEATKFAQAMLIARKPYVAMIRFGIATSTGDAEGDVVATAPVAFDAAAIVAALARFVGTIAQVPPRHAALKYKGRPFYDYARRGVDIPRAARDVEIESLDLADWSPPDATVNVVCSKGTYVRVLAEDLGIALGSGAHLASLRRTRVDPFDIARAQTLDALEAMDEQQRDACLLAPDASLIALPRLDLDADAAFALRQGRSARSPGDNGRFRAYAGGNFVGIVESAAGALRAVRLARTDE